jgi:hypothetical protein
MFFMRESVAGELSHHARKPGEPGSFALNEDRSGLRRQAAFPRVQQRLVLVEKPVPLLEVIVVGATPSESAHRALSLLASSSDFNRAAMAMNSSIVPVTVAISQEIILFPDDRRSGAHRSSLHLTYK